MISLNHTVFIISQLVACVATILHENARARRRQQSHTLKANGTSSTPKIPKTGREPIFSTVNLFRYLAVLLTAINIWLEWNDTKYWPRIPFVPILLGNCVVLIHYRVIEILFIWDDDTDVQSAKEASGGGKRRYEEQPTSGHSNPPANGPSPSARSSFVSLAKRVGHAFDILVMNPRQIGTKRQVKGVPAFSTRDPSYAPSRPVLLLSRAAQSIIAYFLLDWITSNGRLPPSHLVTVESEISIFIPTKLRCLLDRSDCMSTTTSSFATLTREQVIFRTITSVIWWACVYCKLEILHGVLSVLYLLTGLYQAVDVPPFFGSVSEASTVRGFWSSFWHQGIRSLISSLGTAFSDAVLPRRLNQGVLRRYLRIFMTFFFSGVSHAIGNKTTGLDMAVVTGSLMFFCWQAIGIMIEDGAQHIWKQALRPRFEQQQPARQPVPNPSPASVDTNGKSNKQNGLTGKDLHSDGSSDPTNKNAATHDAPPFLRLFEKMVGYAWTLFWISLTTPFWAYPVQRTGVRHETLAYSVIRGRWNY